MAITGINNSSCTSYYASGYKNTVKKAACDIQKTKENSQVSKTEEIGRASCRERVFRAV